LISKLCEHSSLCIYLQVLDSNDNCPVWLKLPYVTIIPMGAQPNDVVFKVKFVSLGIYTFLSSMVLLLCSGKQYPFSSKSATLFSSAAYFSSCLYFVGSYTI